MSCIDQIYRFSSSIDKPTSVQKWIRKLFPSSSSLFWLWLRAQRQKELLRKFRCAALTYPREIYILQNQINIVILIFFFLFRNSRPLQESDLDVERVRRCEFDQIESFNRKEFRWFLFGAIFRGKQIHFTSFHQANIIWQLLQNPHQRLQVAFRPWHQAICT